MNEILELISSYGFPIVCCVFMWLQMQKQDSQIDNLKEALNNNTTVLQRILDKLNMN